MQTTINNKCSGNLAFSPLSKQFSSQNIQKKAIIAWFGAVLLMVASLETYAKPEYRGPGRHIHSDHSSPSRQNDVVDYARVVNVTPLSRIVRVSTPQTECWQEKVTYRDRRASSSTGAILGGIIGAAVGNELGHHDSNKKVGAVAGALLGSSIGKDISRKNGGSRERHAYEENCRTYETFHDEERIDGYLVEYRYKGNIYTTRMQTPPGDKIKVRVHVSPLI